MYQLEVKRWLVHHHFPPKHGWKVHVDVDAMERADHKPGKAERAQKAENALLNLGAHIMPHPKYGRVDIVAEHTQKGMYFVEVEGISSKQKEQAIYSALGQLVLQMNGRDINFVLAVPDDPNWEKQLQKIPLHAKKILNTSCILVSARGIREV